LYPQYRALHVGLDGQRRPSRRAKGGNHGTDEERFRAVLDLPGWQRHGNGIQKTFHLDDSGATTRFAGGVTLAASVAGQQPATMAFPPATAAP
jgi:hypothetical protein